MGKIYVQTGAMADVGLGTTGGGVADLPNHGLSWLTGNETYTLQPPVKGARKLLVATSTSTAAAAVVRGSTGTGVTFNAAGATQIDFAAATTATEVVELVGLSSVEWAIVSAYPVASSGPGPAFSST